MAEIYNAQKTFYVPENSAKTTTKMFTQIENSDLFCCINH